MLSVRRSVLIAASLAVLSLAAPAAAEGPRESAAGPDEMSSTIEIEAPKRVPVGWTGPLYLRGSSNYIDDIIEIVIKGPGGYYERKNRWRNDGAFNRKYRLPPLERKGTYRVRAYSDYTSGADFQAIKVDYPVPAFEVAELSRDEFFPRVRDGYKDRVTVQWRTNRRLFGTVAVLDQDNERVRTWPDRMFTSGSVGRQAWDGTRDNGTALPVGRYRLRLVARDADGRSAAKTFPVDIRRGSGR